MQENKENVNHESIVVAIYLVISARFPVFTSLLTVFVRVENDIFSNYSKEKTITLRWRLITVCVHVFAVHKKKRTTNDKYKNEVVYRKHNVGRSQELFICQVIL